MIKYLFIISPGDMYFLDLLVDQELIDTLYLELALYSSAAFFFKDFAAVFWYTTDLVRQYLV